jgi:hypothetical protein
MTRDIERGTRSIGSLIAYTLYSILPTLVEISLVIAVLWRDEPSSWKGHVGFWLREDATHVHLLGGNQLDEVREHTYPRLCVLGYRWPGGLG